jgi:PAS domain S-box-containing protein
VTERREAVLRAIVQSIPVATIALDAQGIVHVWNPAAEDMFGWPATDMVGGSSPFPLGDLITRVMAGEDLAPKRARYSRRDGSALDVELRAGPLEDDAGRIVGAVLVLTDVTVEQRKSERDLQETRAALARAEERQRPIVEPEPGTAPAEADGDALRDAIKHDQLRLFVQPIVRLADAECVGAEAIVRWQDPDRGLVSAETIFSLAAEYEMSDDLGAWMLERAITQTARWRLERADFRVAVNLPSRAFAQAGFAVLVGVLLRREAVAPDSIDLEVAATALGDQAVRLTVEELRAAGVRVLVGGLEPDAISADGCKIDFSILDDALIDEAHARGRRVIAAGVDTQAQLSSLLETGCDEAQGNFFAPPQPVSDLRTLVSPTRRWRPRGSHLMRRA